jgi:hypothetical protein
MTWKPDAPHTHAQGRRGILAYGNLREAWNAVERFGFNAEYGYGEGST